MPQGAPKSKVSSKPKSTNKKSHPTKIVKPKKASLAQARDKTRKAAAGLTALMERRLVERAGHVELIGPSKSKGSKHASSSKIGAGTGKGKVHGQGHGQGSVKKR